jgi:ATP-dependent DNA helicase PIF1
MNLSPCQEKAFQSFTLGKNIFLTGPGGSGKSHLIQYFKTTAESNRKKIQICAMTGCAAVLLQCKAKTIHSWGGLGMASEDIDTIVNRVSKHKYKRLNWESIDILVIDEVSMLSKKLFDVVDAIARTVRKKNIPFGGIQIVLSGDFYQLPPVGQENEPDSIAFCFESHRWNECIDETHLLHTIFRQTDDEYKKILNQIRIGKITKSTISKLNERVITSPDHITTLYPTRSKSEQINLLEYNKLTSNEEFCYTIKIHDDPLLKDEQKKIRSEIHPSYIINETNSLCNSLLVDKELKLKQGTRVMCVVNLDQENECPIINGSQGVVVGFKGSLPLVKFNNGMVRCINPHAWLCESVPGISVSQIPLIYAWAITIHKSQGITLETAKIDVGSRIFECGQTYVALSRVKTLNGLFLTEFDYKQIKVNRKVNLFYNSLV